MTPRPLDDTASAAALHRAVAALGEVSRAPEALRGVGDDELLSRARLAAEAKRLADLQLALVAGEFAWRSRRELGSRGLAQSGGHRTPEELLRVTTRQSSRDVVAAVRAGSALADNEVRPWLREATRAVTDAGLAPGALEVIATGLGAPSEAVPVSVLADAVHKLVEVARTLDVDRLGAQARELRDELDEAGVADREAQRRARRSLKLYRQPDGMLRIIWLLDPESAAVATEIFDRATSPRRGGPRFVGADEKRASAIEEDSRSTEQLGSDVFLELLRHGAEVQPTALLGVGAPAVRVLVTETALIRRTGVARIEGSSVAVSVATAERIVCGTGTVPVLFEGTEAVNLGASSACTAGGSASHSQFATADAAGRAVTDRPPGRRPTMFSIGFAITAAPTWLTDCSSADITICCCTTRDGRSGEPVGISG